MNYEDPELINRLSAEYVLGTLRGRARQRFQRLMLASPKVREATWQWERQLNQIGNAITEVSPEPEVWQNISQRIDPAGSRPEKPVETEAKTEPVKTQPVKIMPVLARMWQAVAVTAVAASVVLAVYLLQPRIQPESEQLALVQNEQQQLLWLIDVTEQQLSIKASTALTVYRDKDYELWMVLKDQENPVSLGLLPKSGQSILVKKPEFRAGDIALLAVSLEPLGGSPTGAPTQVLYTTPLISL
ncbi:anti-sigma factor [Thalassomonas viridans]|uniref:Anti-sigma factor n=1 Tax=Thalassomonas viridans TaxID=137584 RepID=A0AAE9Z8C0_9GAMM|nr:anti-sigma factor [Thalassomonas viridans]WDE08019.1 anti-sigma factor [Thalassomonas viridans]